MSQFFTPLFYLCFMLLPLVSHAKILDLTVSSYPLFQPVKTFLFLDTLTVTILSGTIPISFLLKFTLSFALFPLPLFPIAAASLFFQNWPGQNCILYGKTFNCQVSLCSYTSSIYPGLSRFSVNLQNFLYQSYPQVR